LAEAWFLDGEVAEAQVHGIVLAWPGDLPL